MEMKEPVRPTPAELERKKRQEGQGGNERGKGVREERKNEPVNEDRRRRGRRRGRQGRRLERDVGFLDELHEPG